MKYIRTKDGIYKVIEECFKPMENNMVFISREGFTKILKQADTVEELCDELVFDNFYHSRMTPSAMHTKENQEIIKGYLNQNITCYGAIWTDKGLIYVAKMNEKGELELL